MRAGASAAFVASAISSTAQHACVLPSPCCSEKEAFVGSDAFSVGTSVGDAAAGRYASVAAGAHGPHSPPSSHSSHSTCTTPSPGAASQEEGTSTRTAVSAGAAAAAVRPVTEVTEASTASQASPEAPPRWQARAVHFTVPVSDMRTANVAEVGEAEMSLGAARHVGGETSSVKPGRSTHVEALFPATSTTPTHARTAPLSRNARSRASKTRVPFHAVWYSARFAGSGHSRRGSTAHVPCASPPYWTPRHVSGTAATEKYVTTTSTLLVASTLISLPTVTTPLAPAPETFVPVMVTSTGAFRHSGPNPAMEVTAFPSVKKGLYDFSVSCTSKGRAPSGCGTSLWPSIRSSDVNVAGTSG